MLSARYLASCSDDLVRLYAEFETQIIQDMARRLAKIGAVSDSTLYQAEIYKEIGGLKKDISNLLSKYDPQTQKILNKLFNEAIEKATEKDMSAFNAAKRELSENQKQIISATAEKVSSAGIVSSNKKVREEVANGGAIKTFSGLQRLTMTIADTASSDFVQQANFAYMQVISGAFTGDFALKNSVKNLAEKGVYTVEYTDSGKTIYRSIESAVRSNIITGINQTCNQITLDNCEATGTDLVEVSAHLGARNVDRDGRPWANHAEWQGKIYSLTGGRNYVDADGNVKYAPDFYETCRPGEPDGIGGVNCRHSFYPYFEGTPPEYSKGELDEMKEPTVTYNDKEITQYEAEQKLRLCERNIRKYKREADGLQSAGLDNTAEKANVKKWQMTAADLCKQTGIRRDYVREFVGKKSTPLSLNGDVVFNSNSKYVNVPKNNDNIKDKDTVAGVVRGKGIGLNPSEINKINVNPEGSNTNCQTTVMAMYAQIYGWDLQAKPGRTKYNNTLASRFETGWINRETGKNPQFKNFSKHKVKDYAGLEKEISSIVKENELYCFKLFNKNLNGHVVLCFKHKNELVFCETQINDRPKLFSGTDYLKRKVTLTDSVHIMPGIMRLDNCDMNMNYANEILERRTK